MSERLGVLGSVIGNQGLVVSSSDGGPFWSDPAYIAGQFTNVSSSICEFNGKLWVAFVGETPDQPILVCSSADGVNWSNNTVVQKEYTALAPSLAVFNGRLWVAFVAKVPDQPILVCSSADGVNWSNNTVVQNEYTAVAPSATAFNGQLWLAFVAKTSSQPVLVCSSADGVNWSGNVIAIDRQDAGWYGVSFVVSSAFVSPPPPPVFDNTEVAGTTLIFHWTQPEFTSPGGSQFDYVLQQDGVANDLPGNLYSPAPPFRQEFRGLAADWPYLFHLRYLDKQRGHSPWTTAGANTQAAPPPPQVAVPYIIGLSVTQADAAISKAGLKTGIVGNPTGVYDVTRLKVAGQDPPARKVVDAGTSVNYSVVLTQPQVGGYSKVSIKNSNGDGRGVHVYLDNMTLGTTLDGGQVALGNTLTLTLQDADVFRLVVVDTGLLNCPGLDPNNSDCQRLYTYVLGSKNGGPYLIDVP